MPQVLWATFRPASATLLPCQLTLAAGCAVAALEAAGRLPAAARGLWAAASAWTATALFMLQPVSQLVLNFTVGPCCVFFCLCVCLCAGGFSFLTVGLGCMVPHQTWQHVQAPAPAPSAQLPASRPPLKLRAVSASSAAAPWPTMAGRRCSVPMSATIARSASCRQAAAFQWHFSSKLQR